MTKQSTSAALALTVAFAASVAMASPAQAQPLNAGQCGPRADIIQALHDEGQVEVISGQRTAIGLPKNIFTSNASLTLGYNLEAGVNAEAGKICVSAKYTNIRLNSDAQLKRPAWASFGANTPHDLHLARLESQDNDKVLMGATAIVRAPDGSERAGPFIMVLRGNPAPGTSYHSAGQATATTRSGDVSTLVSMANVNTNDNFRALSERPVQTAAADRVAYNPR